MNKKSKTKKSKPQTSKAWNRFKTTVKTAAALGAGLIAYEAYHDYRYFRSNYR